MKAMARDLGVATLIPHRGPMHLIDRINWVDTEAIQGEVTAVLRSGALYFSEEERFEAHWLIELSAQASAALYQYCRQGAHAVSQKGYLVSVREFSTVEGVELKAGDELFFQIDFEVEASPLGQSRCEVVFRGKTIAHGELTFLLDA